MKIDDKRVWIFEMAMLVCGVLSAVVYAINFGVNVMRLPSVLTTYTLSSLIGGAFAWNLYKKGGVWRLMIYVYLLSTGINMVISAMWYVMYAPVFPVSLYFQSVLYWLLCSLLPTIICVWSCKSRLKL